MTILDFLFLLLGIFNGFIVGVAISADKIARLQKRINDLERK